MEPSCSDRYFAQFLEAYSQYCLNSEKYMIVRKRQKFAPKLELYFLIVLFPKVMPRKPLKCGFIFTLVF